MDIISDIVFDNKYGLKLDVYKPDNPKGVIILIHGGAWFRGDKAVEKQTAERLILDDFTVIVPNHRLAPIFIYPSAKEDILNVYNWVRKSKYFLGDDKLFAIGQSTGGNLAIEMGLETGIPIASWSGVIDIYNWYLEHEEVKPIIDVDNETKDIKSKNNSFYKYFILNYVNNNIELLKDVSPINRISEKSGPMFLVNSLDELVPVAGALILQEKLTKLKIPTEVKFVKGQKHGEGYIDEVYGNTINFFKNIN